MMLAAVLPSAAAQTAPTASGVVGALRSAGLPIGDSIDFTAESDPNHLLGRPNGYLSKTAFLDTRLERLTPDSVSADDGGSVEVFATPDQALARKTYIDGIGAASPMFAEYSYPAAEVLLRLSKRLTPEQAAQYAGILAVLVPGADVTPSTAPPVMSEPAATVAPSAGSSAPPSSPSNVAPIGMDCPSQSPIKGNKSSSGELIYHVPGGQFYARTQPEACFATATDAQAAGYRASQR